MDNGIIFDIQHNCIYDGPGIRTTVFFKGCPLKCEWCHNPESQLLKSQMIRVAEKCELCGECARECPNKAVAIRRREWSRDSGKCDVCGACANACPTGAMEKIGREASVEEIVKIVLRDEQFYKNSGGGVSISGGEPATQRSFLLALLRALKHAGLHTALETCGYFDAGLVPLLCEHTDLFLFDLKHPDPVSHKDRCGVSNEKIIDNFKKIISIAGGERIIPRIPLIPGVNTDAASIEGFIGIMKSAAYAGSPHLMPYNNTARSKWEKTGRGGEYINHGTLSKKEIERIAGQFKKAGFDVFINS